jgi:hypothetical protein
MKIKKPGFLKKPGFWAMEDKTDLRYRYFFER